MDHSFPWPMALFIFNRLEPTARVFAEIVRQKRKRLLIVAEGPREYCRRRLFRPFFVSANQELDNRNDQ